MFMLYQRRNRRRRTCIPPLKYILASILQDIGIYIHVYTSFAVYIYTWQCVRRVRSTRTWLNHTSMEISFKYALPNKKTDAKIHLHRNSRITYIKSHQITRMPRNVVSHKRKATYLTNGLRNQLYDVPYQWCSSPPPLAFPVPRRSWSPKSAARRGTCCRAGQTTDFYFILFLFYFILFDFYFM